MKNSHVSSWLFYVLLSVCLLGFVVEVDFIPDDTKDGDKQINGAENNLSSEIESLIKFLQKNHYEGNDFDYDKIELQVKRSITKALDPHSTYLTKKEMSELKDRLDGIFAGLGIKFTKTKEPWVNVVEVLPGTPADNSGIKVGDRIISVNNNTIDSDTTTARVVSLFRGPEHSEFFLEVLRGGKVIKIKGKREYIDMPIIKSDWYDSILYIHISSFVDTTYRDFMKEMKKRLREKDGDPSGVILDLRYNPGGVLTPTLKIAELFVSKGELLLTSISSDKKFTYLANKDKFYIKEEIPIVVIINGGTASSAEILAGILRDKREKSMLVGETSFGKGVIQNILPYKKNEFAKITVGFYKLPNGQVLHNKGLQPDVEVFSRTISKKTDPILTPLKEKDLPGNMSLDVEDEISDSDVNTSYEKVEDLQLFFALHAIDVMNKWNK